MELISYNELMQAKELQERYLAGDEVNGKIMYYGILAKKKIENMVFPDLGDLSCHYAQESLFENVIFNNLSLFGVNFSSSVFKNCLFIECSLVKTEFIRASFVNTIFSKCNLFRSMWYEATIAQCVLSENKMDRMHLNACKIDFTVFQNNSEEMIFGNNNQEIGVVRI